GFLCQVVLRSVEEADAFIAGCSMVQPATSFGGVHTSAERRVRWGDDVNPASVRLAIGCEPVEELWAAMDEALG
ncbi:MAG: cystathionine gamma-lyase, partial [Pseudomonadota bacterium]